MSETPMRHTGASNEQEGSRVPAAQSDLLARSARDRERRKRRRQAERSRFRRLPGSRRHRRHLGAVGHTAKVARGRTPRGGPARDQSRAVEKRGARARYVALDGRQTARRGRGCGDYLRGSTASESTALVSLHKAGEIVYPIAFSSHADKSGLRRLTSENGGTFHAAAT